MPSSLFLQIFFFFLFYITTSFVVERSSCQQFLHGHPSNSDDIPAAVDVLSLQLPDYAHEKVYARLNLNVESNHILHNIDGARYRALTPLFWSYWLHYRCSPCNAIYALYICYTKMMIRNKCALSLLVSFCMGVPIEKTVRTAHFHDWCIYPTRNEDTIFKTQAGNAVVKNDNKLVFLRSSQSYPHAIALLNRTCVYYTDPSQEKLTTLALNISKRQCSFLLPWCVLSNAFKATMWKNWRWIQKIW